MSLAMLLLMAYGLIGEKLHEWIGMAMFALFITHHILNRRWLCSITKGRYTPQRIVQTVTAVLILLCMAGSMVSGIVISRYVFDFLKISETPLAVKIHTLLRLLFYRIYFRLHEKKQAAKSPPKIKQYE